MAYQRYLDIHVHNNGHYDFTRDIEPQRQHQESKAPHKKPHFETLFIDIRDLIHGVSNNTYRDYIGWVSEVRPFTLKGPGTKGKIRLNAHGDGQGNICMGMGKDSSAPGRYFARWLIKNGLALHPTAGSSVHRSRGLATISLALCMAAHSDSAQVLKHSDGSLRRSANGSAIDQVISELKMQGHLGIEVTGSHEVVLSSSGRIRRVLEFPKAWKYQTATDGDIYIELPPGLRATVDLEGNIRIPECEYVLRDDYFIWSMWSGGLAHLNTRSWAVLDDPSTRSFVIVPPPGLKAVRYAKSTYVVLTPSIRGKSVSADSKSFKLGGGRSLTLESTLIYETLAKSNAKARDFS